jgi:hypothetical protein
MKVDANAQHCNQGNKQWETINSFRTDNGETVFEDASTKEDAIAKARDLERNATINVVVSKD